MKYFSVEEMTILRWNSNQLSQDKDEWNRFEINALE